MKRFCLALFVLCFTGVPVITAAPVYEIVGGKIKLQIDPECGGVPAGVWFDQNADGVFSDDERMLDSGNGQGLVLKVIEMPWTQSRVKWGEGMILSDVHVAGRLPQPKESWIMGETCRLTAVADSIWRDGERRLSVRGRLIWAGSWTYRLDWEIAPHGAVLGTFRILAKPREVRPSHVLALGLDLRFHYKNKKSFLRRAVHAGIDRQAWELPAGFFRTWYRINALYVPNKEHYGFNRLDEIPWPDYNLVGLVQSGHADCRLWKAIDWDVGHLTHWTGQKSRGWLHVEDREWGVGYGLVHMAEHAPASLSAHLDNGDLTAALHIRFFPEQAPRLNPNHPDSGKLLRPHAFFLIPNAGRWSERLAGPLDALGNPVVPFAEGNPDPNAFQFAVRGGSPRKERKDEAVVFRIDEPAGLRRNRWPFTGGVPFPRGTVQSMDSLTLADVRGNTIPVQTENLAYWPDGSIKWALLDAQVDLPPRTGALFSLRRDAGRPTPAEKITAVPSVGGVRVNTGILSFEIDRNGSGFVDRAWLDLNADGSYAENEQIVGADSIRRNILDYVRSDCYRTGDHDIQGTLDESTVRITELTVERAGPLRAVVLIRGRYANRVESPFTLRLEAFAGKTVLRVQHTFTMAMNPNGEFVHAAGVRLPVRLRGPVRATLGGDGWVVALDPAASVGGLLQENANHAMVWESDSIRATWKTVGEMNRPTGWGDLSDGRWGVTVAVQDFWQEYANGITVDPRNSCLAAYFWPPEAQPLDLRRYSKWMYTQGGETTIPFAGGHVYEWRNAAYATGLSKTSTAVFDFHAGTLKPQHADDMAKGFQQRPLAICHPEYYARTAVAGPFAAYDAKAFPRLERSFTDIGDFFIYNRERFSWYGMIDYGDIGHLWRPPVQFDDGKPFLFRDGWAYDIGRWGWTNTEGLDALGFFMTFFHTGYRPYFDSGEIAAVHNRDVDVLHEGPSKYMGRRHNVDHWGDGTLQIRISQPSHTRFQYYLTGDLRTRDVIEAVFRHRLEKGMIGAIPDLGAVLYGTLVQWEMTGDRAWGDRALALTRVFSAYQGPDGGIQDSGVQIDVTALRRLTDPNPVQADYASCFFHDFGAMHALMEIYYLTDDPSLWDFLVRYAHYCAEKGPANDLTGHRSYNWLLLALALDKTGERRFAERLLSNLSEGEVDRGIYPRDRKYWLGEWGHKIPDGDRYQMGDGRGTVSGVHDVYTVHTGFSWSQMPFVFHVMKKYGLTEKQIPVKIFP